MFRGRVGLSSIVRRDMHLTKNPALKQFQYAPSEIRFKTASSGFQCRIVDSR
jgi:hypothetical protein